MNEQQFKKLLIDMVSMGDYACKDELLPLLKIINIKFEKIEGFAYSGVWNQRKEWIGYPFFQKKKQNQDQFKRLIHRLSEMSDIELTKVEKLLDVFFDPDFKPDRRVEISQSVITDEEQSLDKSIQEAKNKLNTEQFEKRIEQFKQSKKPKNG